MLDIQSSKDHRQIPIAKVGIRNVIHPFSFLDLADESPQFSTVGTFSLSVALEREQKGTHMSRFLPILYEFSDHLSLSTAKAMTQKINAALESHCCFLEVSFDYFYKKYAPISKAEGIDHVKVHLDVRNEHDNIQEKLTVTIPIKSLCPCSKAISDYGAHNQRGNIVISLYSPVLGIKDCISIAEKAASSALYPVLKRSDEKYVTEIAYQNPRFVEDLVRETALGLKKEDPSSQFDVLAENFESIHNHDAWALVKSSDL